MKFLPLVVVVEGSVDASGGQEHLNGALDVGSRELRKLGDDLVDVEALGRSVFAKFHDGSTDVA